MTKRGAMRRPMSRTRAQRYSVDTSLTITEVGRCKQEKMAFYSDVTRVNRRNPSVETKTPYQGMIENEDVLECPSRDGRRAVAGDNFFIER